MAPDRGQVIGRLDDAKLQSWLTATAGDAKATRSSPQNFITGILEGEGFQRSVFYLLPLISAFNSEITAMFQSASSLVASFTKAGWVRQTSS